MLSQECLHELQAAWLPNITDTGLNRLIELLEASSPLLVNGCFTRVVPMGCLATHVAWNHPETSSLTYDAGISWLHRVAGLNPATSYVIREWDRFDKYGYQNWEMRAELLAVLKSERERRQPTKSAASRLPSLVEA